MINFENVTKEYAPDIEALNGVSFNISDGEFVFLVGPSGAGKSTILMLLLRIILPNSGTIKFNNVDVVNMKPSTVPAYRQQFGVVFQDDKLLESKTVRENIEFALEIIGKNDKEIKETTDYLLNITKLAERAELFPRQLSGGEKQRAGIARALANDPKVFVADEPTGDLDPDNAQEIMDIMEKINKWGTTVIVATHNKDLVDKKQSRVIRLEYGKIISDGKGGYGKAPQKTHKQNKKTSKDEPLKNSVDNLDIDKKLKKILYENKIEYIDKILDMTEDDLKKIKGLKNNDIKKIMRSLKKFIKK